MSTRVNIFGSYIDAGKKWAQPVTPERKLLAVLARSSELRYSDLWREAYLNEDLTADDFARAFRELRESGMIAPADATANPTVALTELGRKVLAIG